MSQQFWAGTDFPWEVLSATPSAITYDSAIAFSKTAAADNFEGVTWSGEPLTGAFAARASAQVCSIARSWQQLELLATPGTQLLVDGITAAVSARPASASQFPRGSSQHALFVHWVSPGCHSLEVLFYEPPVCGADHVETMAADTGVIAELGDLRIAYSNTSAVLCADPQCTQTRQVIVPASARGLRWSVRAFGGTALQSIVMFGEDMVDIEGATQVRMTMLCDLMPQYRCSESTELNTVQHMRLVFMSCFSLRLQQMIGMSAAALHSCSCQSNPNVTKLHRTPREP